MQVVYTGPIDAVEIAELGLIAQRGKAVEVPDEFGERLCEQSCWEQPSARTLRASKEQG